MHNKIKTFQAITPTTLEIIINHWIDDESNKGSSNSSFRIESINYAAGIDMDHGPIWSALIHYHEAY
jgi:hypothetical protein